MVTESVPRKASDISLADIVGGLQSRDYSSSEAPTPTPPSSRWILLALAAAALALTQGD